jgi:hypothetical protein
MYKKNNHGICPVTVLVAATLGLSSASVTAGESYPGAPPSVSVRTYAGGYDSDTLRRLRSTCHRYRVTWSGGIARRGPDRISPRPIRTRWQRAGDPRILCAGGDTFSQRRVADQPWLR